MSNLYKLYLFPAVLEGLDDKFLKFNDTIGIDYEKFSLNLNLNKSEIQTELDSIYYELKKINNSNILDLSNNEKFGLNKIYKDSRFNVVEINFTNLYNKKFYIGKFQRIENKDLVKGELKILSNEDLYKINGEHDKDANINILSSINNYGYKMKYQMGQELLLILINYQ